MQKIKVNAKLYARINLRKYFTREVSSLSKSLRSYKDLNKDYNNLLSFKQYLIKENNSYYFFLYS